MLFYSILSLSLSFRSSTRRWAKTVKVYIAFEGGIILFYADYILPFDCDFIKKKSNRPCYLFPGFSRDILSYEKKRLCLRVE